jgi:putative copper export protein
MKMKKKTNRRDYFFLKKKVFLILLVIGILFTLSAFSNISLYFTSYSQVDLLEPSSSIATMPQTETITSYYDALLKLPLIISQTAIVGVVFSHLILQRVMHNRIQPDYGKIDSDMVTRHDANYYLRPIKRFFVILLSCGIAILVSATSLFLLQAISLSSELGIDVATTFTILSSTPIGPVWNLRIITSLIVIVCSILYYILEKKSVIKKETNEDSISNDVVYPLQTKTRRISTLLPTILLYIIILSGAISIFSNSMVSHNTALSFLPSLAISMDWLHFMAVSVWVGGLFYISAILLMTIRTAISKNRNISRSINKLLNDNPVNITSYFLALLLPYFSLIATVSLGIIGITGLYMAWIHLHTAEAIFTSTYGNILAIKLVLALPMVILGAYHQIKLHGNLVLVASIKNIKNKQREERNSAADRDIYSNSSSLVENDPSIKFSKTIKIESLIGIGVLIAASFLTITSPPSISFQESLSTESSLGEEGQQQDYIPQFDSFTILAIILAAAVLSGSIIYFKKSKQQVRNTIAYFENKI